MSNNEDQKQEPLTFIEILGSTFAAALGVQGSQNRRRDFTRGNAVHFIISGLFFVICFVGGLITLVNFVISRF